MREAVVDSSGEARTAGVDQTRQLGQRLAEALAPGDLVALFGDLGSGKTSLIQGLAEGLGVREVVNSPTFVLHNVYAGGRAGAGALTVHHFDLYRLTTGEDLEDIGAAEFFDEADSVKLVEWADRAPGLLPPAHWEVHLAHGAGADERHIRWRRRSPATTDTGGSQQ